MYQPSVWASTSLQYFLSYSTCGAASFSSGQATNTIMLACDLRCAKGVASAATCPIAPPDCWKYTVTLRPGSPSKPSMSLSACLARNALTRPPAYTALRCAGQCCLIYAAVRRSLAEQYRRILAYPARRSPNEGNICDSWISPSILFLQWPATAWLRDSPK